MSLPLIVTAIESLAVSYWEFRRYRCFDSPQWCNYMIRFISCRNTIPIASTIQSFSSLNTSFRIAGINTTFSVAKHDFTFFLYSDNQVNFNLAMAP